MENTLENKARFMALYWGQKVGCTKYVWSGLKINKSNINSVEWLELKPIESITDEEAEKLGFEDKSHFHADGSIHSLLDELRLMGFAVDWAGLTVDELINRGWVKLKTE